MLVDLPADWATNPGHPYAAFYAEHGIPTCTRLSQGHYTDLDRFDIEHLVANPYPFDPQFAGGTVEERIAAIRAQELTDAPHDYGVCDRPEQLLERWPQLATDPRTLLASFREVRRADQPAHGGWRWHKNGRYIGTQNPTQEYLADDTHIDVVYLFEIVELTPATT